MTGLRPVSVTVIAWIYIAAGVVGIAYHATEFNPRNPFSGDFVLALLVRLLAIVAGIFMLRGHDWARWLALLWMLFHVILAGFHALGQFAMHALFLAVLLYFLLRPPATRYFRARTSAD